MVRPWGQNFPGTSAAFDSLKLAKLVERHQMRNLPQLANQMAPQRPFSSLELGAHRVERSLLFLVVRHLLLLARHLLLIA